MVKVLLISFVSLILSGFPSDARIYIYEDSTEPQNSYSQVKRHTYGQNYEGVKRPWMNYLIESYVFNYKKTVEQGLKSEVFSAEEAFDILPSILSSYLKEGASISKDFFEKIFFTHQEMIKKEIDRILLEEEKQEKKKTSPDADKFFSEQEKLEMFEIAKAVKNTLTTEDTLIVLGQSPAYVAKILECLDVNLIHIPLSGIPDFLEVVRCNGQNVAANLLTPRKQQFFRELMREGIRSF